MFNPNPIRRVYIRKGVTADVYLTGVINISGTKYAGFSVSQAIAMWRKSNPINGRIKNNPQTYGVPG